MNKYTVLLLLPESMTEGEKETYLAHVTATDQEEAIEIAKEEAADYHQVCPASDYETLAVLDGWVSDISETYNTTPIRGNLLIGSSKIAVDSYDNVYKVGEIVEHEDVRGTATILAFSWDPVTEEVLAHTTKGNAHIDFLVKHKNPKKDEREYKLCLIERVSEFAFENVECYRNDTTGVAADLSYLLWAIAADTSFLWGTEAPDGLIKLLLEHDTELLKELMDKGYIVKEMLPDQNPVRNIAEVVAVVACEITDLGAKLGGEGLIAHYFKIVDIAEEFLVEFPFGFDWEAHRDNGGDCWDIEVGKFVRNRVFENEDQVEEWPQNKEN